MCSLARGGAADAGGRLQARHSRFESAGWTWDGIAQAYPGIKSADQSCGHDGGVGSGALGGIIHTAAGCVFREAGGFDGIDELDELGRVVPPSYPNGFLRIACE